MKNPELIDLPPKVQELLTTIYPSIDWTRVRHYQGLPWFMQFNHWVNGVTLPSTYSFSRFSIFYRHFNPSSVRGLALIVHEAFHIQQFYDMGKGRGVGFLRPFVICYLADYFKHGYAHHPMEAPAYFLDKGVQGFFKDWLAQSGKTEVDDEAIDYFIGQADEKFVVRDSGYAYKSGWWRWLLAFLLAMAITLVKWFVYLPLYTLFWLIQRLRK